MVGCAGGILGAIFNYIAEEMCYVRHRWNITTLWKRLLEVMLYTFAFSCISFVLPYLWYTCTPLPTDTADWTAAERSLLDELVQFRCSSNEYNQVASLYFTPADIALQQLVRECIFVFRVIDYYYSFVCKCCSFTTKNSMVLLTRPLELERCCCFFFLIFSLQLVLLAF